MKLEFNLAVLYASLQKIQECKIFLQKINGKYLVFKKKREIGFVYLKLAQSAKCELREQLEFLELASDYLAKSKDWLVYSGIKLRLAKFWSDQSSFRKSVLIADSVQRACFNITHNSKNKKELGKFQKKIHPKASKFF